VPLFYRHHIVFWLVSNCKYDKLNVISPYTIPSIALVIITIIIIIVEMDGFSNMMIMLVLEKSHNCTWKKDFNLSTDDPFPVGLGRVVISFVRAFKKRDHWKIPIPFLLEKN